jgi:hypothetical protein
VTGNADANSFIMASSAVVAPAGAGIFGRSRNGRMAISRRTTKAAMAAGLPESPGRRAFSRLSTICFRVVALVEPG